MSGFLLSQLTQIPEGQLKIIGHWEALQLQAELKDEHQRIMAWTMTVMRAQFARMYGEERANAMMMELAASLVEERKESIA